MGRALPLAGLLAGTVALVGVLTVIAEEEDVGFTPPDEAKRRAAVGSLEGLSPALRRAFEPADHFAPIPRPGRYDWLSVHREPGQTYAQFAGSEPNRPDETRHTLYLQPLGEFADAKAPSLAKLERFAEAFFAMEVERRPPVPVAELGARSRLHPRTGKRQLLSGDVLRALERWLPADAFCLLGITMEDLYPADNWNFVFGQASLRERVGIYSFVRYDPRFLGEEAAEDVETLMLRRSCKVLAHEAGHMFGMLHCIHYTCLMNGSNHLGESDSRPMRLCPVCLRKLHASLGFDVTARYRNLLAFHREVGFDDEAAWASKRLEHLRVAPGR